MVPFVAEKKFDIADVKKGCSYADFLAFGGEAGATPPLEFEQVKNTLTLGKRHTETAGRPF